MRLLILVLLGNFFCPDNIVSPVVAQEARKAKRGGLGGFPHEPSLQQRTCPHVAVAGVRCGQALSPVVPKGYPQGTRYLMPCGYRKHKAIEQEVTETERGNKTNIAPEVIEVIKESPVLREWLNEVPNVLEEIRQDPAFLTRVRLGFTTFPSTDDASGLNVGIEDIFIKRTSFTVSADYQTAFNGDRNFG